MAEAPRPIGADVRTAADGYRRTGGSGGRGARLWREPVMSGARLATVPVGVTEGVPSVLGPTVGSRAWKGLTVTPAMGTVEGPVVTTLVMGLVVGNAVALPMLAIEGLVVWTVLGVVPTVG